MSLYKKNLQFQNAFEGMTQAYANEPQSAFENFNASELYCPTCKTSMPVRERLLLVLPSGDLYEYVCAKCGTSLGKKV